MFHTGSKMLYPYLAIPQFSSEKASWYRSLLLLLAFDSPLTCGWCLWEVYEESKLRYTLTVSSESKELHVFFEYMLPPVPPSHSTSTSSSSSSSSSSECAPAPRPFILLRPLRPRHRIPWIPLATRPWSCAARRKTLDRRGHLRYVENGWKGQTWHGYAPGDPTGDSTVAHPTKRLLKHVNTHIVKTATADPGQKSRPWENYRIQNEIAYCFSLQVDV